MHGARNAVGEMIGDINKDLSTVQEVVARTQEMAEKTLLERPDGELKQDKDSLAETKKTSKAMEANSQNRDKLREA